MLPTCFNRTALKTELYFSRHSLFYSSTSFRIIARSYLNVLNKGSQQVNRFLVIRYQWLISRNEIGCHCVQCLVCCAASTTITSVLGTMCLVHHMASWGHPKPSSLRWHHGIVHMTIGHILSIVLLIVIMLDDVLPTVFVHNAVMLSMARGLWMPMSCHIVQGTFYLGLRQWGCSLHFSIMKSWEYGLSCMLPHSLPFE